MMLFFAFFFLRVRLTMQRIGEKHLEWPEHHLDADHILTTVTLYWLTDALPRCVYTYRDTFLCGYVHDIPFYDKPFGYSWFKYEPTPGPRKVVEKKGQLVSYRQHESVCYTFFSYKCLAFTDGLDREDISQRWSSPKSLR